MLDHSSALNENKLSWRQRSERGTDWGPDGGGKLSSPVIGEVGQNFKPQDPCREEGTNTGLC